MYIFLFWLLVCGGGGAASSPSAGVSLLCMLVLAPLLVGVDFSSVSLVSVSSAADVVGKSAHPSCMHSSHVVWTSRSLLRFRNRVARREHFHPYPSMRRTNWYIPAHARLERTREVPEPNVLLLLLVKQKTAAPRAPFSVSFQRMPNSDSRFRPCRS